MKQKIQSGSRARFRPGDSILYPQLIRVKASDGVFHAFIRLFIRLLFAPESALISSWYNVPFVCVKSVSRKIYGVFLLII